jgi:hypothetical protein
MLGGLGFIKPDGLVCKLTNFQRQFASFLDQYQGVYTLPRFMAEDSIKFHEPYLGEFQIHKVPSISVNPKETFRKIPSSNPVFILQPIFKNILVYRMFTNDILKLFRKSAKNRTNYIPFSIDDAFKNKYPYNWVYQFTQRSQDEVILNKIKIYSKLTGLSTDEMFNNFILNTPFLDDNITQFYKLKSIFSDKKSSLQVNKNMLYRRFRNLFLEEDHKVITGILDEYQKKCLLIQNLEYRLSQGQSDEQTNSTSKEDEQTHQ